MVAYGIYSNTERADNDHQVILSYDTRTWRRYGVQNLRYGPFTRGDGGVRRQDAGVPELLVLHRRRHRPATARGRSAASRGPQLKESTETILQVNLPEPPPSAVPLTFSVVV